MALSISTILSRIPNNIQLDTDTYINTSTKCRFIDEEYGEFWAAPCEVFRGQKHPKRAIKQRAKKKLKKERDIIRRLPPFTSIDMSTYKGLSKKARFIDEEYGEFWARPGNVIWKKSQHPNRTKDKIRTTNQERYGSDWAMSNPEIARKSASRVRTNSNVGGYVCQSWWEAAVVAMLIDSGRPFNWQIPFSLDDGSTYICDLYLLDQDIYVEIKGRWHERSKGKWLKFKEKHPNSEVWNRHKLISMGIIDSHGFLMPKHSKRLREKHGLSPYCRTN